ncbi:hypothetical protein [Candidatus Phytoplasma meliae]|uniref:Uncharacterized protein n=1 Tax=Candidatus Phytoplasma meliae TaxID=1848402 RepID=A0ABS5CXU2_9MOLU|nr:hypothetical protein [Candidatus Phytoplasma meliae]MBP5835804.1 hypothetical protein [Candidatus Phytoplasma meliae]MBP5836185.1 hypothetical protein [Candidatus Phytoplasma meliae]
MKTHIQQKNIILRKIILSSYLLALAFILEQIAKTINLNKISMPIVFKPFIKFLIYL